MSNPKSEIRNKTEIPKPEFKSHVAWCRFEPWNFRILNLSRISDFELWMGGAPNGGMPAVRIVPERRVLLFTYAHPLVEPCISGGPAFAASSFQSARPFRISKRAPCADARLPRGTKGTRSVD